MATLIENFADILVTIPGAVLQLDRRPHEMLVTVATPAGRKQSVKVSLVPLPKEGYLVVRLLSRACQALHHRFVREALRANAGESLCNLALDLSTTPASINVVYTLVAENLQFTEFMAVLQNVAWYADSIERQFEQTDRF